MTTAGEDQQIEKLLARIEALEAKKAEPPPFWRNTAAVGILGGVIAVTPAILTTIQEYFQTDREVQLNRAKYHHERTVSYLDRALSPETTEAKQAQVLRFLSHLPEDDPIRKWADEELREVQQQVEQIKKDAEAEKKKLATLETKQEVLEEEAKQIRVEAVSKGDEGRDAETLLQANQAELESTREEIAKTEMRVQVAAIRAGAPELAEPVLPVERVAPSGGKKSWRVRIAAHKSKAAIEQLAALASRGGQGTPELYFKNGMYYLFLGRYGSREAANEHVGDHKRLLGQGAWVQNIDDYCPSPRKGEGYWRCDE